MNSRSCNYDTRRGERFVTPTNAQGGLAVHRWQTACIQTPKLEQRRRYGESGLTFGSCWFEISPFTSNPAGSVWNFSRVWSARTYCVINEPHIVLFFAGGGIARNRFLSFWRGRISPFYGAPLWRDSIAGGAKPKGVVQLVGVAARIDAHCNLAGRRNIVSRVICGLTCANFRCRFVTRST